MSYRTIFRSEEMQKEFDKKGYVIVNGFFTPDQIEKFRDLYAEFPETGLDGFFTSLYVSDAEYKQDLQQKLRAIQPNILDEFLIDYKILVTDYIIKTPVQSSLMHPHQDWTFVDERQHVSLNVWWPLEDVTHENGAIYILSGGHKIPFNIRGTEVPYCYSNVSNLNFETLTYLPMQKGDVLIYDHKVVHASPPNTSTKPRLAIGMAAVPKEAQIIHYIFNEATKMLDKYEIDEQFYINYTYGKKTMPAEAKLLGTVPLDNPAFSNEDIEKILGISPKTSSIWDKCKQLFNWK